MPLLNQNPQRGGGQTKNLFCGKGMKEDVRCVSTTSIENVLGTIMLPN